MQSLEARLDPDQFLRIHRSTIVNLDRVHEIEPYFRLEYAERSEIEVATVGQTAVVSSRWRGRGTWQMTQFVDDQRCTLALTRTSDGWRILSEHCTQIAP